MLQRVWSTLRHITSMTNSSSTRTLVHLHTFDLRIHDLPSLHLSHSPSSSIAKGITHFLPIYIFDERSLDLSLLPNSSPAPSPILPDEQIANPNHRSKRSQASPLSRVAKFHRTSPHRLRFLLESVFSLRETYRRSGGDLIIGYGRPEILVPKLLGAVEGAIEGVWAQEEVTVEETTMLDNLREKLRRSNREGEGGTRGIKLELNDSKVFVPLARLPFEREKTPDVYTSFRKKVEGLGVERGGMIVEPLKTTSDTSGGTDGKDLTISIGQEGVKLKPLPKIDLESIELEQRKGGFLSSSSEINTLEGLFSKLVKPLMDHPPIAGWSQTVISDQPPEFPECSPIPFEGGEIAALQRLEDYVGHADADGQKWVGGEKAKHYKATRNGLVGEGFSTKFSGFFALGCLSAKEVGWRVGELLEYEGRNKDVYNNVYWILFELLWRDFFQHTTYRYSLQSKASLFLPSGFSEQISTYPAEARPNPDEWASPDWSDKDDAIRRWCEGRTGVPFIDANMRELRETGSMSNRGRQNVASFLTKDLYADWRVGAEFFEMHLVDYDTCSNWGNWQYQAGVGNDPRSSRQFNPIKQAQEYDPQGEYVRLWVPELKDVPDEYLETPWLLNDPSKLGGYPAKPVVELPSWKKFYPGNGGSRHRKGGKGKH